MAELYRLSYDWLEVWALLIPLFAVARNRRQPVFMKPVVIYLVIALFLYLLIDIIWKQKSLGMALGVHNNNPLYNLNSILRFFFFSSFFIRLRQPLLVPVKKILPWLFLFFVLVNFIFFEDFFRQRISSKLHSVETILLLFYCLQFYFYLIFYEPAAFTRMPSFWVVTGLSILLVVSFGIYVYYDALLSNYRSFTINIWRIHKLAYLVFLIFLSKAFYTHE